MKKGSLPESERRLLLEEIRSYLPAFLAPGATEQPDPAGDVRELLGLDEGDLERVIAVHQCLAPAVLDFGERLENGLRRPCTNTTTTTVSGQAVRGPIDWPGTIRQRARAPGEVARYAMRQAGPATYAVAENRAVAWLLGVLEELVDRAVAWSAKKPAEGQAELGWARKIDRLRRQLALARQVPWLRALEGEKPTPSVLRSMRSSRDRFYARVVPAAIDSVTRLSTPSPDALVAVLSERYFEPADDGTLFQVAVALRLAEAFRPLSPEPRKTRLLMGDGRSSYASYGFKDGSEVSLAYQAWPDDRVTMRRRFVKRHRLADRAASSIPDLILIGRDPSGEPADAVVIELKASRKASYLRDGLMELLAYLADRPELWGKQPMGWLVAPPSAPFEGKDADPEFPIWILSADDVAAAATARFVDGA